MRNTFVLLGIFIVCLLIAFLFGKGMGGDRTLNEYEEKITILELEKQNYKREIKEKNNRLKEIKKEVKKINDQFKKINYHTNFYNSIEGFYGIRQIP